MRKVSFDPANQSGIDKDEWKHWKDKAEKAEKELLEWFEKKNGNNANTIALPQPELKKAIWKELKDLIFKPVFDERCAYCEAEVTVVAYGDAEHYRPKKGVEERDSSGTLKPIKIGNEDHLGYPWLAYDWQNLIPGCSICNGHKGNLFPVAGDRCAKPEAGRRTTTELNAYEQPQLLHPYFDDPKKHLHFDESGVIAAKNRDPRGKATINICQLDRERLQKARHAAQLAAWQKVENLNHKGARLLEAIRKVMDDSKNSTFSLAISDYLQMKLDEEVAILEQLIAQEKGLHAQKSATTDS